MNTITLEHFDWQVRAIVTNRRVVFEIGIDHPNDFDDTPEIVKRPQFFFDYDEQHESDFAGCRVTLFDCEFRTQLSQCLSRALGREK